MANKHTIIVKPLVEVVDEPPTKCQCMELYGLFRVVHKNLVPPTLRCGYCVDMITESKNELVRENNRLREEIKDLVGKIANLIEVGDT